MIDTEQKITWEDIKLKKGKVTWRRIAAKLDLAENTIHVWRREEETEERMNRVLKAIEQVREDMIKELMM